MTKPIRISAAASLGLHAAAIMAGARGERVSAGRIAEFLGASEAHLSKVLARLVRAGLVRSTRGPRGGFRLTRPPNHVTVKEIYEAIEGELDLERCLFGSPVCGKEDCALAGFLERLSRELEKGFARMTLTDIRVPIKAPAGAETQRGTRHRP